MRHLRMVLMVSVAATVVAGCAKRAAVQQTPAATGAATATAAQSAAPGEQLLTPPQGWVVAPSHEGVVAAWYFPGDPHFAQNINVTREEFSGQLDDYVKAGLQADERAISDVSVSNDSATTVCGNRPAHMLEFTGSSQGHQAAWVQVITLGIGFAYVATYTRDVSQAKLPEAMNALASLCVK